MFEDVTNKCLLEGKITWVNLGQLLLTADSYTTVVVTVNPIRRLCLLQVINQQLYVAISQHKQIKLQYELYEIT